MTISPTVTRVWHSSIRPSSWGLAAYPRSSSESPQLGQEPEPLSQGASSPPYLPQWSCMTRQMPAFSSFQPSDSPLRRTGA